MNSFIYSVWFLNSEALEEDQDREWVACIAIAAASAEEAQQWGDVLAHERGRRVPTDTFVSSSVELESDGPTPATSILPRIRVGEKARDALIGW